MSTARAIGLTLTCILVLANDVFVGFAPVRLKLVTSPVTPVADQIVIRIDDPALRAVRGPLAMVARIRNNAAEPQAVELAVDGDAPCISSVPGSITRRVNCVLRNGGESHDVLIKGEGTTWQLEYLYRDPGQLFLYDARPGADSTGEPVSVTGAWNGWRAMRPAPSPTVRWLAKPTDGP